jgi:hypothetical protein
LKTVGGLQVSTMYKIDKDRQAAQMTYTRAYLQSLQTESIRRKELLEYFIAAQHPYLEKAAREGKKFYFAEIQDMPQPNRGRDDPYILLTKEELIEGFRKVYPGCALAFKEVWVDITPTTRALKRGVVVDWS